MQIFAILLLLAVALVAGWFIRDTQTPSENPVLSPTVVPTPYEKYSVEGLSQAEIKPGILTIRKAFDEKDEEQGFGSYLFSFEFDPDLDGKDFKKTTGVVNIPNEGKNLPVVVMFRGYIDQSIYTSGDGTRNAGRFFADNGYITIAPDFLGYAESDENAANIFESRFQTYTTAISFLRTVEQMTQNSQLLSVSQEIENSDQISDILTSHSNINIWGHSNGGQITITLLESTGVGYPTTLWAPVTKPFPYSVLYYTDTSEDRGKFIRSELAKFENVYDADRYSIEGYLDKINAPLQIHQGTSDTSVPKSWSDEFVQVLNSLEKDVDYYVYPGADHNLRPFWDSVVESDLEFFQSQSDK